MKCGEIKNKYPQMDITINSREAKQILEDLEYNFFTEKIGLEKLNPETKFLYNYLKKLRDTNN